MTGPTEHPHGDLAVLALGVLDADERAGVQAHLAGCAACRAELAELQDGAGLLATVDRATLDPAELAVVPAVPPVADELGVARLVHRAREEQSTARRGSVRTAVGAAAAALVIGVAGAATVTAGLSGGAAPTTVVAQPPPPAGTVVLSGSGAGGVGGEVSVQPAGGFVRMALSVSGVEPGTRCGIVVVTTSGERVDAGSWTVGRPAPDVPRQPVQAAAAVPVEDVAAVEVETLAGAPVLTLTRT